MLWSLVFGNEGGVHLDRFSLVAVYSELAILGSSSSLCVSHPEHIVRLNPSVHSRVPGNGVSKLLGLVFGIFDTVENFQSVIFRLIRSLLAWYFQIFNAVESFLVFLELLICYYLVTLLHINAMELHNGLLGDRLL